MLYDLFNRARKDGLAAVEADVEEPGEEQVFPPTRKIMSDKHVRDFICDTLRTATTGVVDPFDLDQMMEADMEVHHHDATQPVAALSTVADSLPGLGIVAAVLGVVITMGALGGRRKRSAHKVAAALVGTFLGILLCYGLVGPLAANMAKAADEERRLLPGSAGVHGVVHQGHAADRGRGTGAARHSGARPAHLSRTGEALPQAAAAAEARRRRPRRRRPPRSAIRWPSFAP